MTARRRLMIGALAGGALIVVLTVAIGDWPVVIAGLERRAHAYPPTVASRIAVRALALLPHVDPVAPPPLPPPPPMAIGINASGFQYYEHVAPFANLVIGSLWQDGKWRHLPAADQDADGNIVALPEGIATRFLNVPPTGPEGIEVACTWTGSGSLTVQGGAVPRSAAAHRISFRVVNRHDVDAGAPWLALSQVDPARPFRDLDCRETRLAPTVRFRSAFVETLRGYSVVRFMDWQDANVNAPVTWATRHRPGGNRLLEADGVPIEDMMALARTLGADPWFVMPWNADDDYITRFAQLVARTLPPGRHAYVETANEVWNDGFPVARQATAEGLARGLSGDPMAAQMRRYAQRTVEVMRLWEGAFAGRAGLVRVLSVQHVRPDTARVALSFGDTATHVDALATAPYFGATLAGTANSRETVLARLTSEIDTTLAQAIENRRVAISFGKRYIAYEGGEGLALPAQKDLTDRMQYDPAQADLYRRYLAGWRRGVGDLLCHYTGVMLPAGNGAWGLSAWEDETPAQAPKLRAIREAMARR